MTEHLYGKYRAWVVDNADPYQEGRLRVRIDDVAHDDATWAVASWPPGQAAEEHHLPEIGTQVWVEFERGDVNHPVWDGVL